MFRRVSSYHSSADLSIKDKGPPCDSDTGEGAAGHQAAGGEFDGRGEAGIPVREEATV